MSVQDSQAELDLIRTLFDFDPEAPEPETPHLDIDSIAVQKVLVEALRPYRDSLHERGAVQRVVSGFNDWLLERAPERIAPDRADLLFASVKDAAAIAKVSERTVRRYIATGELVTQRRKGPKGTEHRINLFTLYLLLSDRTEQFARATFNPMAEIAVSLGRFQQSQEMQTARLEQTIQQLIQQQRNLEGELRDARAQLNAMNDQILKALPAPNPPEPEVKQTAWAKLAARFKR